MQIPGRELILVYSYYVVTALHGDADMFFSSTCRDEIRWCWAPLLCDNAQTGTHWDLDIFHLLFSTKCPNCIALPAWYQHVDWILAYLYSVFTVLFPFFINILWVLIEGLPLAEIWPSASLRGHMMLNVNANLCGICFYVCCYTKARWFDIVSWWQHSVSFTEVSESRDV